MITAGFTLQLSLVNLQGSNKHEFPFMRRKLVISASTESRLLSCKEGHNTMDGTSSKLYEFTHSEKNLIFLFFFSVFIARRSGDEGTRATNWGFLCFVLQNMNWRKRMKFYQINWLVNLQRWACHKFPYLCWSLTWGVEEDTVLVLLRTKTLKNSVIHNFSDRRNLSNTVITKKKDFQSLAMHAEVLRNNIMIYVIVVKQNLKRFFWLFINSLD